MAGLTAFALNCTLTPSSAGASSTGKLLEEVLLELSTHGVTSQGSIRLADFTISPGVSSDEGGDDEWPDIRTRILDADIFVLGTPIWMGHACSNAQRVLERLDAFLGEIASLGFTDRVLVATFSEFGRRADQNLERKGPRAAGMRLQHRRQRAQHADLISRTRAAAHQDGAGRGGRRNIVSWWRSSG